MLVGTKDVDQRRCTTLRTEYLLLCVCICTRTHHTMRCHAIQGGICTTTNFSCAPFTTLLEVLRFFTVSKKRSKIWIYWESGVPKLDNHFLFQRKGPYRSRTPEIRSTFLPNCRSNFICLTSSSELLFKHLVQCFRIEYVISDTQHRAIPQ